MAYSRRKVTFNDFARNLSQEVEKWGLSEEEFMADLEQTKRDVFTEQYGRPHIFTKESLPSLAKLIDE